MRSAGFLTNTKNAPPMPNTAITRPIIRSDHSAPVEGCTSAYLESANVGSRKCSSVSVTPGMPSAPAMMASTASGAIAAFIGNARSAIACSGPGKPTSVSSGSPVAGL